MYPSLNNFNDNFHSTIPQEPYHAPSFSSFLLPYPGYIPLEDEAVFCEFFQQQEFYSKDHNRNINLPHDMPNNVDNNGQIATNGDGDDDYRNFDTLVEVDNDSPRKIPSNRDRHSKVNTARGPRDRRMRLSLDVAKRLFGLQDLLGFDKASKTVDWLLTESKAAILDLLPDRSCSFMDVFNNTSSTSECEVVSGSCDQFMVKTGDDEATTKNKAKSCSGSSKKQKDKTTRARKCAYFQHPLAKEIRARARQRARERTIQKQNNYSHGLGQDSTFRPFQDHQMDEDVNQLGSWSTFQGSQCQLINQVNDETSSNLQFNQGFVGDNSSLSGTGSCTPSYLFDYDNNSGLTDEHQFNDLKIRERAWEG